MEPALRKAVEKMRDVELRAATVMEAVDCLYSATETVSAAASESVTWSDFKRDVCPACRSAQGLLSSIRDLVQFMEVECAEIKQLCAARLPCAHEEAA